MIMLVITIHYEQHLGFSKPRSNVTHPKTPSFMSAVNPGHDFTYFTVRMEQHNTYIVMDKLEIGILSTCTKEDSCYPLKPFVCVWEC